jgi:PAS domain S-box-containing protein
MTPPKRPTRRKQRDKTDDRARAVRRVGLGGEPEEDLYRRIVEAAPGGLLMADEAGTIVLVNALVEQQFGYTREELMGQPVEMLVPERFRANHQGHRARFHGAPSQRQMGQGRDLFGVRKNRSEFPIEIGLTPIQTDKGLRILAAIVDITERKALERQLRQTERLAEVGTLAAGMAHEIGTPMNVILGRAEQLMRKTHEEVTKKSLGVIVAQVERITKIMNQLLTFARRKPSERRSMNLGQTLSDCLEVLQERIRLAGVRVESNYGTMLPPLHVHADRDQMSQVFLNLFINALHAMPNGGTLYISLEQVNGQVRTVIADTGHGIPKEDLPRIFHPFFTTKEAGKGTGLGLTVVHGIVQEHGGSIAVDSESGRGTTFTITLPAAKSIEPIANSE